MTDWPALGVPENVTPLFFNTGGMEFSGFLMRAADQITAPVTTAWVQNLAIYQPFLLKYPYTIRRFFWVNGSTLTGPPHVDIGIFSWDGVKLCSTGAISQSGTSSIQFANSSPLPYRLVPGRYWLGIASESNAVSSLFCYGGVSITAMRNSQIMQQATAYPLPATATFAAAANALLPYGGFTRTASGF